MADTCFVCRREFAWELSDGDLFEEDPKWKYYGSKIRRKAFYLDAKDIERKYFVKSRFSYHWTALYRLIEYDPVEKKFLLSGIGHYVTSNTLHTAAKEPNKALIGGDRATVKKNTTRYYDYCQFGWWVDFDKFPGDRKDECKDWRQLPLIMHMGCWKLAQWVLGPSLETSLELFAAVMLDYSVHSHGFGRSLFDDPYRIPQIQELIACSRVTKKKTNPKLGKVTKSKKRTNQNFCTSQFLKLPMDLLYMMLDFLACEEIQNLGKALGIEIPDSYWRRRTAWDLAEIDEIAEDNLDWEYLCANLEKISHGPKFKCRRYVLRILRDKIKPVFQQNLEERVFPSLDKVMVHTLTMIHGPLT